MFKSEISDINKNHASMTHMVASIFCQRGCRSFRCSITLS